MSNIYNILSVTLLLHRTNIKTYIKHKFRKEIIPNNGENPPYKPIMDNVMDCLMERDIVEIVEKVINMEIWI